MRSCGDPQHDHIRPQNKLFGFENEMEDADVAYENKFTDGGSSGSKEKNGVEGAQDASAVPHGNGEPESQHLSRMSGEMAKVKTVRSPVEPSKIAREDHDALHLPYRSWCVSCVAGRGVASPHISSKEKHDVDEIGMDYCFPGGMMVLN